MATIIYPSGRQEERQPANGSDFQLEELRAIVEGSIEIVKTKDGRILVCNEESKLEGLPYNELATHLVDFPSPEQIRATLKAHPEIIFVGDLNEADYIAGTVLVCKSDEVR